MSSEKVIQGIHHITAIAGSAAENVAFYENVLGLRLVKQTVNFDDPFTYHLYYGDQNGNPGTILTFFPWQGMVRGVNGRGMVTAVAFEIPVGSSAYWRERLLRQNIETESTQRFGEEVIRFSDPHGLRLELIATGEAVSPRLHTAGSIAPGCLIKGFHSATSTLAALRGTQALLEDQLGMKLHGREGRRYRFTMKNSAASGLFYDLVVDPEAENGRQGIGSVHHIAFRTPDDTEQLYWQRSLLAGGYPVTGVRDRKYFKSIYFHEPGGVLFEIATDPPGFGVDETPEALGQALQLPDNYEPMRADIENALPPLRTDAFVHKYLPPSDPRNGQMTIIALHGTGGDEHDLIPFAQQLARGAAILSPRGKVIERGMNRFFARLSPGVFDTREITKRAHELADFLLDAAGRYKRPIKQFVGLGYSNGANIAAAILLLRPEVLSRAILLRPMLPLLPAVPPDLSDKKILILKGTADTVNPPESTDQLIQVLKKAGAQVEVREIAAGHELTQQDPRQAVQWLAGAVRPHLAH